VITMPYYCADCGEKEEFEAVQYYSYEMSGECTALLDSQGEVQDRQDFEDGEGDGEYDYGDLDDITCGKCGNEVEWYETSEIEEMEAERIKEEERKGSWKAEMEKEG
jgi:hypothetical protein